MNKDVYIHCESKKLGHFVTAYNFRNIEQIFNKLGINHVLFILNIMPSSFESTLENSGAIWRITLNVNKKVIKVMNWQ